MRQRPPGGELADGCLASAQGSLGCAGRCGCRWHEGCFAKTVGGCDVGICTTSAAILVIMSLAVFFAALGVVIVCRYCWQRCEPGFEEGFPERHRQAATSQARGPPERREDRHPDDGGSAAVGEES
uniref:Uncharacterized protein n=1 Tax=Zooxanthella nutricula TaxID=1333877 RepID=A0A7S2JQ53_9DINO